MFTFKNTVLISLLFQCCNYSVTYNKDLLISQDLVAKYMI